MRATTTGELADVVAGAKAVGAFDAGDLAWCRALWTALGPSGHWAAIALVRRELGGELVSPAPEAPGMPPQSTEPGSAGDGTRPRASHGSLDIEAAP